MSFSEKKHSWTLQHCDYCIKGSETDAAKAIIFKFDKVSNSPLNLGMVTWLVGY